MHTVTASESALGLGLRLKSGLGLGLGLESGLRLRLGLESGLGLGLESGLGLGGGEVPTTVTRLVRCDNRV